MKSEVISLLNRLHKDKRFELIFYHEDRMWCYQSSEVKVMVVVSDIGMLNAAFSILDVLSVNSSINFITEESMFINIGTVGARGSYNIGDIVKVGKCYNLDFNLSMFGYKLYEYPRVCEYYNLTGDAVCYTSSKFLESSSMVESISEDYIVDMELFGLLYSLDKFRLGISVESYKVVTDISDGISSCEEHTANLEELSDKLCSYIYKKYINITGGKRNESRSFKGN